MSDFSLERSEALLARASKRMPGGVNSPVRAFRAVQGNPPFIASAKGAWLTDEDGNQYVDLVGSWGPAILGHAHPEVVAAVTEAAAKGTSFGAPTVAECDLADRIAEFFPSMEMMRLVSSGTEACMSALRLARGFTGRDGCVKFEGCYHGHADSFLVKAGSGMATFGEPNSAGVPADLAKHTLTLPFNDVAALEQLFAERGSEIACIILEPVAGNMGLIEPSEAFLKALATVPKAHGALVIFDEVMCGFRVHRGGAQALYAHVLGDWTPDLTCLGKVVGGGLPVGVYGGRADVMGCISPLGKVYQAGTLSGNPLATAAGIATLDRLSPELFDRVAEASQLIAEALTDLVRETKTDAIVVQCGTMITVFFCDPNTFGGRPPQNFAEVARCDHARFGRFHREMLERGVYLPPSGYEAWFVSAEHGPREVAAIVEAAREALPASLSA